MKHQLNQLVRNIEKHWLKVRRSRRSWNRFWLMPQSQYSNIGDPVWAGEHSSCEGDPEISSQRSTGFASRSTSSDECINGQPPMELLWSRITVWKDAVSICFPCHTWVKSESGLERGLGLLGLLGFRACKQPTPMRTLKRW
jgi:hypothetical protein